MLITLRNKKFSILRFSVQIIFIIFLASILFTLYYLYVNSFKTSKEFTQSALNLPESFNFKNYIEVWRDNNINYAFRNNIILVCSSSAFIIVIGILASYAYAVLKFKLKKLTFLTIIGSMFLSPLILIIPLYLDFTKLNLNNTYIGTILIYSGIRVAFVVFIMTTFFREIPKSIVDSAKIDGCTDLRLLTTIFIPLSKAAIFSVLLLNFFAMWNDLIIGMVFMRSAEHQTLAAAIARFKEKEVTDITHLFTGLSFMTTPIILLYALLQRYFVKGMMMGSLKE